VFGARGAAEARVTTAGSVAIGPAVVQAPEIGLLSSGGVIAGTLGNGFLEHFVVTIDYPRLTLWLDPGAPGPSP
ncbi:MAG: hypothetical protein OEO23_12990, partial [Gemmatimonadota bacterium]|nr:hypothetical protein [Gemmatimonadota bacterium]